MEILETLEIIALIVAVVGAIYGYYVTRGKTRIYLTLSFLLILVATAFPQPAAGQEVLFTWTSHGLVYIFLFTFYQFIAGVSKEYH